MMTGMSEEKNRMPETFPVSPLLIQKLSDLGITSTRKLLSLDLTKLLNQDFTEEEFREILQIRDLIGKIRILDSRLKANRLLHEFTGAQKLTLCNEKGELLLKPGESLAVTVRKPDGTLARRTLCALKGNHLLIHGPLGERIYPVSDFLKECEARQITLFSASDSHSPQTRCTSHQKGSS